MAESLIISNVRTFLFFRNLIKMPIVDCILTILNIRSMADAAIFRTVVVFMGIAIGKRVALTSGLNCKASVVHCSGLRKSMKRGANVRPSLRKSSYGRYRNHPAGSYE